MVEMFQNHPDKEHALSHNLEGFSGFEKNECFLPLNKGVPYKRKFSKFYNFLVLFTAHIWSLWTKMCSYRGRKQTWIFVKKSTKIAFFLQKKQCFCDIRWCKNEFHQKHFQNVFRTYMGIFKLTFCSFRGEKQKI